MVRIDELVLNVGIARKISLVSPPMVLATCLDTFIYALFRKIILP
jgi:hypothetical protein